MKQPIILIDSGAKLLDHSIHKLGTFVLVKDADIMKQISKTNPGVILTIGDRWEDFPNIAKLPIAYRNRWIHLTPDEFDAANLTSITDACFIHNVVSAKNCTISVFTTTFNTGPIILRTYNSLKYQSYNNWEWIVVDDSTNGGNTYELMDTICASDPRVKVFRPWKHSGFIGEVKRYASALCSGFALVELDHDDELDANILHRIFEVLDGTNIGFVYSDFTEPYDNGECVCYGLGWGKGFGSYTYQLVNGKWMEVAQSPNINPSTISDICGAPNHVRCWRKNVMDAVGGFNPLLYVADDYDLVLRTFLGFEMAKIPYLGYIQHKSSLGNHSNTRNPEIRKVQKLLYDSYARKISQKFMQHKIPESKGCPPWERSFSWHEPHLTFPIITYGVVTIVMSTYNRGFGLSNAINSVLNQTFKNFELIIIGDFCPIIDDIMKAHKDPRIRWWNLDVRYNDGGTTPKNYALRTCLRTNLVAYLDDDNEWKENHLESLMAIMDPTVAYAFSSFSMDEYTVLCREPKLYRIDTSALLHRKELLDKYGYWRTHKDVGYAHDFELVSRWTNETYAASLKPTLIYSSEGSLNNPRLIWEAYDDQISLEDIV